MIKLGNNDITLKIGSADVSAAYLGSVLIYSGGTPPTPPLFNGKWLATYTGGTTSSAECDASSAITQNEITLTDLVSVEIGDCVTRISGSAFSNCGSLTSITISDSVTNIGNIAFRSCSSLTSVTIPNSVTSIGLWAFRECTSLSSITCLATTPPSIGGAVFSSTNDCPIYVPAASVSAYQSAWSDYASRIQAIPTPSPQWVTFNSGDDISGLQVYGVKGTAYDLYYTFNDTLYEDIFFDLSRNIVSATIGGGCYTNEYGINDNVEIVFSNVGCSDYYTIPSSMTAGGTIQLYIYQ